VTINGRFWVSTEAELAGVEPRAYPGEAARRAVRNAGTFTLHRDLE